MLDIPGLLFVLFILPTPPPPPPLPAARCLEDSICVEDGVNTQLISMYTGETTQLRWPCVGSTYFAACGHRMVMAQRQRPPILYVSHE